MEKSDEGLYTVLADNGRGLPADARVTLKVDDNLERQIPGMDYSKIRITQTLIRFVCTNTILMKAHMLCIFSFQLLSIETLEQLKTQFGR